MINLEKFTQPKKVLVPIIDGWGQKDKRKIYAPFTENGWYWVSFGESSIFEKKKATSLDVLKELRPLKKYYVYALGTEGIPMNFDNFKKIGEGQAVNVNFLSLPIFTMASIVRWEDGRFYFFDRYLSKGQSVVQRAKEAFKSDDSLPELPGATPELRYYFLLGHLQRESCRALAELTKYALLDSERTRRIAAFQNGFPARLKRAIELAGGVYKRHTRRGKGYMVEWEVGGQVVKSIIKDTMSIENAGFCLSGQDKLHSINSIIQLAQLYQEKSPLYITRE